MTAALPEQDARGAEVPATGGLPVRPAAGLPVRPAAGLPVPPAAGLPVRPAADFVLPDGAEAGEPPEHRGLARDAVRLLVVRGQDVTHHRFRDLPELLTPGDLVVVNTSATLPAAVDGTWRGRQVPVHMSAVLDDGTWAVELRRPDGTGPELDARRGEVVRLPDGSPAGGPPHHRPQPSPSQPSRSQPGPSQPGPSQPGPSQPRPSQRRQPSGAPPADGLRLTLREPWPDPHALRTRLWRALPSHPVDQQDLLGRIGRPVSYGHSAGHFPLEDHQTVFADEPGSAEMASAARPFTAELVVRLAVRGVAVAPVVLHAGVSSPELHEPPLPERFAVPRSTAALVHATRVAGGRVVAVGTTVTRALESAADPDGNLVERTGWTDLVLGPHRPARVVTGLVTGLHAPQASHLLLLEAVAGADAVRRAYDAAVAERYRWHEFGDSSLFLP